MKGIAVRGISAIVSRRRRFFVLVDEKWREEPA